MVQPIQDRHQKISSDDLMVSKNFSRHPNWVICPPKKKSSITKIFLVRKSGSRILLDMVLNELQMQFSILYKGPIIPLVRKDMDINEQKRLSKYYTYTQGASWLWLYGSWIYNYLCNQCLSPLNLLVRVTRNNFWNH